MWAENRVPFKKRIKGKGVSVLDEERDDLRYAREETKQQMLELAQAFQRELPVLHREVMMLSILKLGSGAEQLCWRFKGEGIRDTSLPQTYLMKPLCKRKEAVCFYKQITGQFFHRVVHYEAVRLALNFDMTCQVRAVDSVQLQQDTMVLLKQRHDAQEKPSC